MSASPPYNGGRLSGGGGDLVTDLWSGCEKDVKGPLANDRPLTESGGANQPSGENR
jgi:hypothetical protein